MGDATPRDITGILREVFDPQKKAISMKAPAEGIDVSASQDGTWNFQLPTNAATESTLSAINSKLISSPSQDRVTANAPNSTRLTDGTNFYKSTTPSDIQPVSVSGLPLPSGASTETTLSSINSKLPATPALEHTTAVNPNSSRLSDGTGFYKATTPSDTQPVNKTQIKGVSISTGAGNSDTGTQRIVLASDNSAVAVNASQSGTWNVGNVSGAVSLPTGAASASNQSTEIASLQLIDDIVHSGDISPSKYALIGAVLDDISPGVVTENNANSLRMSSRRALLVEGVSSGTPFSILAPTLTKGAQSVTGLSVQDLKDSGRTQINLFSVGSTAGATGVETALTLTKSSGSGATSTGTSFVVTNGKTFRISSISVATRGHATATAQTTTFNFRLNTAGAVTTSSTPVFLAVRSATPATSSAWDRVVVSLGDGYEISGTGTLQIGVTAASAYVTNAPTWDVTIFGFEY